MTKNVSYGKSRDVLQGFDALLCSIIEAYDYRSVCDVGGGSNPVLPQGFVREKGLDYTVLDISREELDKAPEGYEKVFQDISEFNNDLSGRYDLVFSRMVAEHVRDGGVFHRNVFSMLREGGTAVHLFPTLYAFPYVANMLLPEAVADFVIQNLAPRSGQNKGKFPAHYSWCRGPSKQGIARFEEIGYEVIDYRGLYGHWGYYRRLSVLKPLHERMASFLVAHPTPHLTSYACVILLKPSRAPREKQVISLAPVTATKVFHP